MWPCREFTKTARYKVSNKPAESVNMLKAAPSEASIYKKEEGKNQEGHHPPQRELEKEKALPTNFLCANPRTKSMEERVEEKRVGGKYRKLIDILSDENILRASYQRIRSNPGNMIPDPLKESLDGIPEA